LERGWRGAGRSSDQAPGLGRRLRTGGARFGPLRRAGGHALPPRGEPPCRRGRRPPLDTVPRETTFWPPTSTTPPPCATANRLPGGTTDDSSRSGGHDGTTRTRLTRVRRCAAAVTPPPSHTSGMAINSRYGRAQAGIGRWLGATVAPQRASGEH